ncbi:MAG: hypothetical protein ACRDSE_06495 [Pseudonocardiaceae bacterium]
MWVSASTPDADLFLSVRVYDENGDEKLFRGMRLTWYAACGPGNVHHVHRHHGPSRAARVRRRHALASGQLVRVGCVDRWRRRDGCGRHCSLDRPLRKVLLSCNEETYRGRVLTTSVNAVITAKSRVNTPPVINTPPAAEMRDQHQKAFLAEIVTRTR